MLSPERALLYARTVRHLRPSQVWHRGRLRAQKAALARWPAPIAERWRRDVPADAGWPAGFASVDERVGAGFPSAEANADGRFRFIGDERSLGEPPDWDQRGASQLWRYHLHYFEWAWAFATHPDRAWARDAFARLWSSWSASTRFGRWDAWSPYVVSLRAWVLCGVYERLLAGGPHGREALRAIALHAGFVRRNLEQDVGGNHLVKNLKALAGLGVFLGDDDLVLVARSHLARQVEVQILADGGHYERSPSYHCQVLGDLIDVAELLRLAGAGEIVGADAAIARMRQWLGDMLLPDGDVPLFNDCELIGKRRLRVLAPAPRRAGAVSVLLPSGYVVVRPSSRIHFVMDVGPPCPSGLPAHAHADCLSFELVVDGRRVVVDTGTSTYVAGRLRHHERSTAAHNTVEVDGYDQTEVWGTFRAARRAEPLLEDVREGFDGAVEIRASHDGYERLKGRPRHRRIARVSAQSVELVDEVDGAGTHRVVARLHLADGVLGDVVRVTSQPHATVSAGCVATSHGNVVAASVVTAEQLGTLPIRFKTTIDLVDGDRSGTPQ
jgi:uncharacterized heparinase superfamily protein